MDDTKILIRLPEVIRITGLSKSRIYAIPSFPRAVLLNERAVAWVKSEVDAWIEQRIAQRDATVAERSEAARRRQAGKSCAADKLAA